MRIHCWFIIAILFLGAPTGCSTPRQRAFMHILAFRALPAADRQLVLQGKIHFGMGKSAVYIAWGSPDQKLQEEKDSETLESWLYECRLTLTKPCGATDQYGPYHGLGFPLSPSPFQQDNGFRGIGDNAFRGYQPHVRVIDVRYRRAEFSGGELVGYVDRRNELQMLKFQPVPVASSVAVAPGDGVVHQPAPPRTHSHANYAHHHNHYPRRAHPHHHRHVDQGSTSR